MVFVLALFAAALAYAAWCNQRGRALLLGLALLNVAGAVAMAAEDYPFAYTLKQHTTAPGID